METHKRTMAKTISWRVCGTLITSGVVWIVTGKGELGISVATLDCLIKLIIYYAHERAWNTVTFGYQPALVPTSTSLQIDADSTQVLDLILVQTSGARCNN